MDVVREFVVGKLKGSLDVFSELGQGTMFRLTIPLTLAIIRALLVRVGEQVFALPTGSIEETLRGRPSGDHQGRGPRGDPPATSYYSDRAPERGPRSDGQRGENEQDACRHAGLLRSPDGLHRRLVRRRAADSDQDTGHPSPARGQRCRSDVLGAGEVVPILNVPDLMNNARQLSGLRRREPTAAEQVEKERRRGRGRCRGRRRRRSRAAA